MRNCACVVDVVCGMIASAGSWVVLRVLPGWCGGDGAVTCRRRPDEIGHRPDRPIGHRPDRRLAWRLSFLVPRSSFLASDFGASCSCLLRLTALLGSVLASTVVLSAWYKLLLRCRVSDT